MRVFYIITYTDSTLEAIDVTGIYENERSSMYDYRLASRKEWINCKEACSYARALASKNNLTYKPFDDTDTQEGLYLD